MIWLPLLIGLPLAAVFAKLGSTLAMVSVLTLALSTSMGVILSLLVALVWLWWRRR